jgi:hypothetical protein
MLLCTVQQHSDQRGTRNSGGASPIDVRDGAGRNRALGRVQWERS